MIADNIANLPDAGRDELIRVRQECRKKYRHVALNFTFVGMVLNLLDRSLSRAGRVAFLSWVFDRPIKTVHKDISDLTVEEMFAVVMWAGPHAQDMDDGSHVWTFKMEALNALPALINVFSGGVGQMSLMDADNTPAVTVPTDEKMEARKARRKQIMRELGYREE